MALKKTQVKLDLSTDVDMLLMVERDIRGGACNSIHQYAKANNNNTKDYDKNKESSYLNYSDINKSLRVGNVKKNIQHLILNGLRIPLSSMKIS